MLTTRELGRMIREFGLDFAALPEENFDSPLGKSTGAGVIFGTTGGVMEAALRTVADVVTGQNLSQIEYKAVRGMETVREAALKIGDVEVKVAVVHTLKSAKAMMEKVKAGQAEYHFIEMLSHFTYHLVTETETAIVHGH